MWIWLFADNKPAMPGGAKKSTDPDAAKAAGQVPPGAAPTEEEEEDAVVGAEINEVLETSLPWMASILFHLGLIVLALFIYFIVIQEKKEEDKPIIPIAKLSQDPGGELTKTESTELQAKQNERVVESKDTAEQESLKDLNSTVEQETSLIGAAGGGGGGKLAPFGNSLATGVGAGAKFYGTGGNATRIVYVVDASGSLIDTLPFVLQELRRSIGDLVEQQSFSVIFFQQNRAIECPPPGQLKKANAENKQRLFQWMDPAAGNVVAHGSSNPMAALKAAMRLKPQLVFILSDNITGRGKYEVDKNEILEELEKLNKDKKTLINTIQFLYPDDLGTLKTVSENHGGIYKFVKKSDLGLD